MKETDVKCLEPDVYLLGAPYIINFIIIFVAMVIFSVMMHLDIYGINWMDMFFSWRWNFKILNSLKKAHIFEEKICLE